MGMIVRAANMNGESPETRQSSRALIHDFAPSGDEAAANRLSVWDRNRTEVHEMLNIMRKTQVWPVFELDVDAVSKIASPGGGFLRVADDPEGVPEHARDSPGVDGHCPLIGSIRPREKGTREHRRLYRAVRKSLANLARLVAR